MLKKVTLIFIAWQHMKALCKLHPTQRHNINTKQTAKNSTQSHDVKLNVCTLTQIKTTPNIFVFKHKYTAWLNINCVICSIYHYITKSEEAKYNKKD